jgi:hypothetical protein
MNRRPRYRSSIPARAKERVTRRHPDGTKVEAEYVLRRSLVGNRQWDENGLLEHEVSLRSGRKHGVEYWWTSGRLTSAEPWVNGVLHGTAKQWMSDGRLLGTYTMRHGTGIDLWRQEREDGSRYLSEVLYLKNGRQHGFQWFIDEDQRTVYIERHWLGGRLHGVWREWNSRGRFRRGYPKYFVAGKQVAKRRYIKASAADPTLPPFRKEDNKPARTFPREIAHHLRFPR